MTVRRKSGFTLVELIVTSTIVAMLVTSIIGLTLRLERQRQSLQTRHQRHAQVGLLRETIQRDLRQCTGGVAVNLLAGQLTLKGHLATDPTGAPTSGNAVVTYAVDQNNLIRVEQQGSQQRVDLLWGGVRDMTIRVAGMQTVAPDSSVPDRLRFILVDLQGLKILDTTTTIRSDLSVEVRDE